MNQHKIISQSFRDFLDTRNKVWLLPAYEDWICDRLVIEFNAHNSDIVVAHPLQADVIWLFSDWNWNRVPYELLRSKKVITTVHHIVPEKFDNAAMKDFKRRDEITDVYHVFNERTKSYVKHLTTKTVAMRPYWANQDAFPRVELDKKSLCEKYNLPQDKFLIGSFQRDTEGSDLISPKLEKGPDLFADAIELKSTTRKDAWNDNRDIHIVLAGWRRQYIISRLEKMNVPYTYIERPEHSVINDLYQTIDLYAVAARQEGGPQSLIECGLTNTKVVSTPVGIAEQVLSSNSINENIIDATPSIPSVEHMRIPNGFREYRELISRL